MLILGVTADDKGAQLEQLVRAVLEQQGYKKVRSNVIGAGGNELDVVAVRESIIVGGVQVTNLVCEAKAHVDPVNMPAWQRFLGKLFIQRGKDFNAVGMLVALNGVNGNVMGSYNDLKTHDSALFLFEGTDLIELAIDSKQVAEESAIPNVVATQFHKLPSRIEVAFYRGAFYWQVRWTDDEYSVVDGHGRMLLSEDVEGLRDALEATVSGTLLASDQARAEAEARHLARLGVINRLFRGEEVLVGGDQETTEAARSLSEEPFTRVEDDRLILVPPSELDAPSVARLFTAMFENTVRVAMLSFMIDGQHAPYVVRLIELIPDLQAGFTLREEEARSLTAIAPLFPSVWAAIASPIPMITTHRVNQRDLADEATLAADRAAFWEAIVEAIRRDYGNARLHGFLYDYVNVAELEQRVELVVKTKTGIVGLPIRTETRDAVRQYSDESLGDNGSVYVMVRLLPRVTEPWDDGHPAPAFPLN